jgi:hypothetical protein
MIVSSSELRKQTLSSLNESDSLKIKSNDFEECATSGIQLLCSAMKTDRKNGKKINLLETFKPFEDAILRSGISLEMIIQ